MFSVGRVIETVFLNQLVVYECDDDDYFKGWSFGGPLVGGVPVGELLWDDVKVTRVEGDS